MNFLGNGGEAALNAVYPPATLVRLIYIKRRYDPGNLFRSNLCSAPSPRASA